MMPDTPAKPAVLLVEDNYRLSDELKLFLSEEGFDVRCADCGEAMDQALKKRPADVLILDLNLPEEDGISIVKRIRTSLPAMRILILTARTMSSDKVMGYESGADVGSEKEERDPITRRYALQGIDAYEDRGHDPGIECEDDDADLGTRIKRGEGDEDAEFKLHHTRAGHATNPGQMQQRDE